MPRQPEGFRMNTSLPKHMQAVLLESSGGPLTVGRIPVPAPGPGQLLLRMAAAPINPSDLGFLNGSYGFRKPFPIVPGLEGSGTVIAALLDAAPAGSTVLVYGRMSGEDPEPASQGTQDGGKRIDRFFLPDWLAKKSILQVLLVARKVQRLATHELETSIRLRFPLSAVREAIEAYSANPTAGKVLLMAEARSA